MASNATSNGASNGTPKPAANDVSLNVNAPSDDLLYHVKCEIIDYLKDPSGATHMNEIYGTYTSLPAAKAAALTSLKTSGYLPSDFADYAEKSDPTAWKFGDDVLVYAKAPAGQEFRVRLDVTPNTKNLTANADGEVEGRLHYVLQTNIDYNKDASGACQSNAIQGVYLVLKEANHAAYNALLGDADGLTRTSYEEFDRVDEHRGDWPYGDHVLVHAVAENGENFRVEVRTRAKVHHKREDTHRYEAGAWK